MDGLPTTVRRMMDLQGCLSGLGGMIPGGCVDLAHARRSLLRAAGGQPGNERQPEAARAAAAAEAQIGPYPIFSLLPLSSPLLSFPSPIPPASYPFLLHAKSKSASPVKPLLTCTRLLPSPPRSTRQAPLPLCPSILVAATPPGVGVPPELPRHVVKALSVSLSAYHAPHLVFTPPSA